MKRITALRSVVIGEGIPKICVPLVSPGASELMTQAQSVKALKPDIIEWRVDFFDDVMNIEKVKEVLAELRLIMNEIPIIFTFRSIKEGGNKEISDEFYFELNQSIISTELVDAVDLELFSGKESIKSTVELAHNNNVKVIISNHDFNKTPGKSEIIDRLTEAERMGGDIAKIAVMPNNAEDVIVLMDATRIMNEKEDFIPIITMSMAGKGVISRLSGELFGSAVTFGSVGKASAPGQISVDDLRRTLQLLHTNL